MECIWFHQGCRCQCWLNLWLTMARDRCTRLPLFCSAYPHCTCNRCDESLPLSGWQCVLKFKIYEKRHLPITPKSSILHSPPSPPTNSTPSSSPLMKTQYQHMPHSIRCPSQHSCLQPTQSCAKLSQTCPCQHTVWGLSSVNTPTSTPTTSALTSAAVHPLASAQHATEKESLLMWRCPCSKRRTMMCTASRCLRM